jgi:hypothetical protein
MFAKEDYIKLLHRINSKFTNDLKAERQMFLFGSGGRLMDDVELVDLSYHVRRHATIDEARQLYVEAVEKYLNLINSDEKIRPFLRNYPFTINNLEFDIGFVDQNGRYQKDVAFMLYSKRKGKIIYCEDDPKEGLFNTIYEEPYEEAVRIVREQRGQ